MGSTLTLNVNQDTTREIKTMRYYNPTTRKTRSNYRKTKTLSAAQVRQNWQAQANAYQMQGGNGTGFVDSTLMTDAEIKALDQE